MLAVSGSSFGLLVTNVPSWTLNSCPEGTFVPPWHLLSRLVELAFSEVGFLLI